MVTLCFTLEAQVRLMFAYTFQVYTTQPFFMIGSVINLNHAFETRFGVMLDSDIRPCSLKPKDNRSLYDHAKIKS